MHHLHFDQTHLYLSPSLLDCLIKYEKKEIKIEDLYLNSVWANENLFEKDYKNLHSFFGYLVWI
jgi:hypothetical protein